MNRYRISTCDPGDTPADDFAWVVRHAGLTLWGLRDALREVRGMGYEDELSILVERERAREEIATP